MAKLDLSDVVTVMDMVIPAANETDYELDSYSVSEKGGTRTLTVKLSKDLEVEPPPGANGGTVDSGVDAAGAPKPSDAQVQRIHHSAGQGAGSGHIEQD